MLIGRSSPPPRTIEELLGTGLAARLDRLDLLSRKVLSGKLPGERRSKRRGRSVEFDDFRAYVEGDDPRHIDWNILGRLDRLVVKLFREEEDLSLQIVLDGSASMETGEPSKLVFGARLAMAMAYLGLVNQNRVSVAVISPPRGMHDTMPDDAPVRELAPMRGRVNVRRVGAFLLEMLDASRARGVMPGGEALASFDAGVRALARARLSRRSGRGITLLISDFLFARPPRSLRLLAGESGEFDTYAVQVLSPGERDPESLLRDGLVGDLRLTDIESARGMDVTVTPATIATYKRALERSIRDLQRACARVGIAHFLVQSDTAVDELVLGTLRRGGMLR